MTIESIVLSNKLPDRLTRHLLFWVGYLVLFQFQNDNRTLLYVACYMPACIICVYGFGHILITLPKKKKYIEFALGAMVIFTITLIINYYTSKIFFANWGGDEFRQSMVFGLAVHNQVIAISLGGITMGIKATKNWYFKQRKNAALERTKYLNQIKLEKASLYPEIILQALRSLQVEIEKSSDESPALLVKLSDLLSYLLYDSQDERIELKREISMVKALIGFKKLQLDEKHALSFSELGNDENKFIVPLTLFKYFQDLMNITENNGKGLLESNVRIEIENESVYFEMTAIYLCGPEDLLHWRSIIANTESQLEKVNYGASELKVDNEECMLSIGARFYVNRSRHFSSKSIKTQPAHNVLV